MKEAKLKVELVQYTPMPVETVGRAGGICYDKEEKESYDKFVRGILHRGHESVIEHANFTFRVEGVSRALTHQWVRHRLCSFSQRSQRYCKEDGFMYIMPPLGYLDNTVLHDKRNGREGLTLRDEAIDTLDEAFAFAEDYYSRLYNLRGIYKKECPHYEYKPIDVNIPAASNHWCGDQGEYIVACPMVCKRFHKVMFNKELEGNK